MKILVIEDDIVDAVYLESIISDAEIDILAEPPSSLDNEEYDLIIVDYFLEETTSKSFLNKLSDDSNFKIPLLILSGKVEDINLGDLSSKLNMLVLSKNENLKDILPHYLNFMCKKSFKEDEHDYKTLLIGLIHDLKNDLTLAHYLKDPIDSLTTQEIKYFKECLVQSALFAHTRLEDMSSYLNDSENYLSLKEAYEKIKQSYYIAKRSPLVDFHGEDFKVYEISGYYLTVIIKNLVENACKYASDKRALKISLSYLKSDSEVIIEIKDNAQGMSFEKADTLFSKKQDSQSGLGIGLVVLNRIITSCNGKTKVKSEEGIGTTIQLSFKRKLLS